MCDNTFLIAELKSVIIFVWCCKSQDLRSTPSLSIFQSGSFAEAKLELVRIHFGERRRRKSGCKRWRVGFCSISLQKWSWSSFCCSRLWGQTCWPTLFCKAAQRQDDETWTAGSFRHHPAPLTLVVCASKPSSQRPLPLLWVDWEEQFF
jgi:hypothetical protein